jgi:hypothetical protein
MKDGGRYASSSRHAGDERGMRHVRMPGRAWFGRSIAGRLAADCVPPRYSTALVGWPVLTDPSRVARLSSFLRLVERLLRDLKECQALRSACEDPR